MAARVLQLESTAIALHERPAASCQQQSPGRVARPVRGLSRTVCWGFLPTQNAGCLALVGPEHKLHIPIELYCHAQISELVQSSGLNNSRSLGRLAWLEQLKSDKPAVRADFKITRPEAAVASFPEPCPADGCAFATVNMSRCTSPAHAG